MSWIGAERRKTPHGDGSPTSSSLEYPTTVSGRGVAPANAIVEHLTASECRFRTIAYFERGEVVEFDFAALGGRVVHARGCVVSNARQGARFAYHIRIDRMSARETDELARAVAETYRKQARSRAQERAVNNLPTTDGLTRSSVRVLVQFPIFYRSVREGYKVAKAGDVSTGGLSIVCREALVREETLDLRFTLPSDALGVHPEQTAVLDLRTRAVKHMRSDLRRPFEEMTMRARVASGVPVANGIYKYGLAFVEADEFRREELARYVHAVQLSKRRLTR